MSFFPTILIITSIQLISFVILCFKRKVFLNFCIVLTLNFIRHKNRFKIFGEVVALPKYTDTLSFMASCINKFKSLVYFLE